MARAQHGGNTPVHGQKRHAEDELESDQRLTKRFGLLYIDRNRQPCNETAMRYPSNLTAQRDTSDDMMLLDDTKDKVYIHDLDAEVAEIESNEGEVMFLPGIEKRMTAIPKSVLGGHGEPTNNQLVLYQVPSSLSVPGERDSVRKAIVEARARSREKSAREDEARQANGGNTANGDLMSSTDDRTPDTFPDDPDAMDIG